MSKHIELAKKLKALADKGIGGEKINAEKMLNDLLKKHNLTIEEIEGEKKQDYYFNVAEKRYWNLLYQIIKNVNYKIRCFGEIPKTKIRQHKLDGNYLIECTTCEYVEIEAKFDFYSKLFKSELDTFFSAFIEANDLGVDDPSPENKKPLTKEEYSKLLRIQEMALKIKKGDFHKQLVAPK